MKLCVLNTANFTSNADAVPVEPEALADVFCIERQTSIVSVAKAQRANPCERLESDTSIQTGLLHRLPKLLKESIS